MKLLERDIGTSLIEEYIANLQTVNYLVKRLGLILRLGPI